jgi:hypothetical protein
MTIIGESNPLPDTPIQLAGEILSDMLTEDPKDSLHIFKHEITDIEREKLRSYMEHHLLI